ncbi:hypothetical protein LTS10_008046 [Elasticomyces elasticus]|nr:hypothetical protein LTS10_008046 [Elasticomyces elasticus]
MYVSARGQVEFPPGYNPPTTNPTTNSEDSERPAKRQKKSRVMAERADLDAHSKAPDSVKIWYKRWQRMEVATLATRFDVIDCEGSPEGNGFPRHMVTEVLGEEKLEGAGRVFKEFMGDDEELDEALKPPRCFEVKALPGLLIYPSILPEAVQLRLLNKLLHRDLSNPQHQTNVHLHYNVPYAAPQAHTEGQNLSFFDRDAQSLPMHNGFGRCWNLADISFHSKPKAAHAALDVPKMLDKKLRWMTLGGQYDWTSKTYPSGPPPPFPQDVKDLVEGLFPMKAEAAIVNLYSPGDTLSAHRDVSEACAQPLVSISLGCEAIFIAAIEDEAADPAVSVGGRGGQGKLRSAVLRLRSGDAVVMRGEARYAWHGVPRVKAGSCPAFMKEWPAVGGDGEGGRYEGYKGWMGGKRVNLNVRQMFAEAEEEEVGGAKGTVSGAEMRGDVIGASVGS